MPIGRHLKVFWLVNSSLGIRLLLSGSAVFRSHGLAGVLWFFFLCKWVV